MQTLSLLSPGNNEQVSVETELKLVRNETFRYAFLALLALNVFLIAGGASFALLYFSR